MAMLTQPVAGVCSVYQVLDSAGLGVPCIDTERRFYTELHWNLEVDLGILLA